jgi:hypothetical protein
MLPPYTPNQRALQSLRSGRELDRRLAQVRNWHIVSVSDICGASVPNQSHRAQQATEPVTQGRIVVDDVHDGSLAWRLGHAAFQSAVTMDLHSTGGAVSIITPRYNQG